MRFIRNIVAGALVAGLALSASPAHATPQAEPADDPHAGSVASSRPVATHGKVIAQYYPWWEGPDSNWMRKPWHDPFSLQPTLSWYTNQFGTDAIASVRHHIETAHDYGVYGFGWQYNGMWLDQPDVAPILTNTFLAANNSAPKPIKWSITFDSDQWSQHHGFWDAASNGPRFGDDGAAAAQFAAEMEYLCSKYTDDPNYIKVGDRPLIFLFGFNRWTGPQIEDAIEAADDACGGVKPWFVGDFQYSAIQYPTEFEPQEYLRKAALVSAVSNYTLFGGYGYASQNDSAWRYAFDKTGWDNLPPGKTRLQVAFENARDLSTRSGKPFYPGLIPQYFKISERDCPTCQGQVIDDSQAIGYIPTARADQNSNIVDASRAAVKAQWDQVKKLKDSPDFVFVTSWNEPVEGTMVEPTLSTNGEGYAMGDDFLREVAKYTGTEITGELVPVVLRQGAKVLTVESNSTAAGAKAGVGRNAVRDSAKWRSVPWRGSGATGSQVLLMNLHSNLCLAGDSATQSVVQLPCSGELSQLWTPQPAGTSFHFVHGSGQYLSVAGPSQRPAIALSTNADNAKWSIQQR